MSKARQIDIASSNDETLGGDIGDETSPRLHGLADITVHVDGGPRDEAKIAYAEAIGAATGAHV
ncbi:hypothetical protein [Aureimonas sp. Leaf454]|uniref:hypothetical protein n=1 Tax=Aureimonas sp. Leaf454 TaxID=1736381 RepID=UPI000AE6463F|nr:hypothetical protein [Aureimonas sp. Leaf454]